MSYARSFEQTRKVATIKLDTAYANGDLEARAIYALCGGYNQVARGVDVDEFRALQDEFHTVVAKMMGKLNLAEVLKRAAK